MSKNQIIIALVVLCLLGTIWGSVQDKKSTSLERQLVAMRSQAPVPADAHAAVDAVAADTQAVSADAQAEIDALTSQNQELLAGAATLKGTVTSLQDEITSLKKELTDSDATQAVEVVQEQLDKSTAEIVQLEEAFVAAKAALAQKEAELIAAEEATAGLEDVKSTLANSVDSYNARSQELAAEVEEYGMHIAALEKALEGRTKLLVAAGEELARTKLNMNVLLSKIAAQNNSIEILDETRVALEKELATKFLIIEELQHQIGAQVVDEIVVVEEVVVVEEDSQAEEAAPEAPAEVEHVVESEEVPAH